MVTLLKKAVFFIDLSDASLGCYSNGRENGFCLKLFEGGDLLAIAFSEYRNSNDDNFDDIVVYVGGWMDFEMQGNVPSEEVYENKKMFGSEEQAVEYIVTQIKEFKKKTNKLEQKILT